MSDLTAITKRLEHGWALIDEAMDAKQHTEAQRLTDHWLVVEKEYRREADVTLWEIESQHEWRPSMRNESISPVPFVREAITPQPAALWS
jgi:hypothetical protein